MPRTPQANGTRLTFIAAAIPAYNVINGKVMMILYHNSQADNGKVLSLTRGKIQIQSEGSEIYYRHIRIESIDETPAAFLKQQF